MRPSLLVSFAFMAAFLTGGCNGILWGNLGVLCVTVGIFLGTVFLSRKSTAARSTASSTPSANVNVQGTPRS